MHAQFLPLQTSVFFPVLLRMPEDSLARKAGNQQEELSYCLGSKIQNSLWRKRERGKSSDSISSSQYPGSSHPPDSFPAPVVQSWCAEVNQDLPLQGHRLMGQLPPYPYAVHHQAEGSTALKGHTPSHKHSSLEETHNHSQSQLMGQNHPPGPAPPPRPGTQVCWVSKTWKAGRPAHPGHGEPPTS